MNIVVLALAIIIPFPLCLFRRKAYNISFRQMLLIYLVFSCAGAVGACVGAFVSGEVIRSQRLYGLMLFDEITLLIMHRLLKMESGVLGDFVSVPLMAVCFSAKIDCIHRGCCYGIVLCELEAEQVVRFPSAIFEMAIWGIYVLLLLAVEKKGKAVGTMWPLTMIWFGFTRYMVDFLRGSLSLQVPFVFGMTAGRFWSLIVLVIGFIHLYFSLKHAIFFQEY